MFSESVQYTSRGRFVYTQVTKTVVSRGVQSLGSGFPIGASSIPVGTRFSAGKSSVLYLLRHHAAAAEQADFVGCKLQKTRNLP